MEKDEIPAFSTTVSGPIRRSLKNMTSWFREKSPTIKIVARGTGAWLAQIKPAFCLSTVIVAILTYFGSRYVTELQTKNQTYLANLQAAQHQQTLDAQKEQHEQLMKFQNLENEQLNQREMLRTALSMLSEKQEKNEKGPIPFDDGEQAVRKFAINLLNRFCTEAGYESITDPKALTALTEGRTNIPGTWSGLGYSDYSYSKPYNYGYSSYTPQHPQPKPESLETTGADDPKQTAPQQ